ncbi:antibiotic biosynthesis monooxygenase [Clostridium fermenticellae]|uniref:Antibiotic biosynthesis monooxygenase n=1 Tax=Clostridium fermenticellae TaxID=2068654 RepID=A0A386H5B5_9CLOT|nr:putative quinol monooxygenase [Clostridium fermenticellae]AYD40902.1 antibiotic biosynthesis monooxygenase [Clostridium fermenticellae]
MIRIISKNQIKPNKKDEFIKLTNELIEKSRKEDGCIAYNLFEDINNPFILTFVEDWENQESINNHNNSEHFKRIVPQFQKFRSSEKEFNLYRKLE